MLSVLNVFLSLGGVFVIMSAFLMSERCGI